MGFKRLKPGDTPYTDIIPRTGRHLIRYLRMNETSVLYLRYAVPAPWAIQDGNFDSLETVRSSSQPIKADGKGVDNESMSNLISADRKVLAIKIFVITVLHSYVRRPYKST